jgi:hypothetical protein
MGEWAAAHHGSRVGVTIVPDERIVEERDSRRGSSGDGGAQRFGSGIPQRRDAEVPSEVLPFGSPDARSLTWHACLRQAFLLRTGVLETGVFLGTFGVGTQFL